VGHRWVDVTTVPMLYLGYPLYRLGGYRLALLLPMLGAVAAALAARALARRLGADEGVGWAAFFLVAVASPLAIYALDFWEHSIGVALMGWGVVLLLDALRLAAPVSGAPGRQNGDPTRQKAVGVRSWGRAAATAGLLFGAAATLRTEALVYAA